MKIENQVCSLGQAKKFSELKVGEDAQPLFVWVAKFPMFNDEERICTFFEFESRLKNSILSSDARAMVGYYPAFTLSELGQMLDSETYTQRLGSEDSEYANWEWVNEGYETAMGVFSTEVLARADMLITCLGNGSLSAETCNKRLAG